MSVIGKPLLVAGAIGKEAGAIASFPDGNGGPFRKLIVGIEPVQAGTGDPSPTNIRPITGYTGTELSVNGQTINIDWSGSAGAIAGGTLDVLTGKLTVTHLLLVLTGEENFTNAGSLDTGTRYFRYNISDLTNHVSSSITNRLCSHYPYTPISIATTGIGYSCFNSGGSGYIAFRPDLTAIDTPSKLTQFFAEQYAAGTPVQCVVPIASGYYPTYQLTPQQISTFLGQNTLWADAGPVDVEYTKRSIMFMS